MPDFPRSQLMWVLADVVGLFSVIVGPFSRNVGRSHPIFSANLGRKQRMLSGPADYVLGPLHLAVDSISLLSKLVYERLSTLLGATASA